MARLIALIVLLACCWTVVAENKKPAAPDLIATIEKSVGGGKLRAIDSLGALGAEGVAGVEVLTACAEPGQDPAVRVHAVKALGQIGSFEALPTVRNIEGNKQELPTVRTAAKQALAVLEKIELSDDQKLWLQHAHEFAIIAGKAVRLPPGDLSGTNSRHLTPEQARAELRKEGRKETAEEIREYSTGMPGLHTGSFGQVFVVPNVLQILGPYEMLVQMGSTETGTPLIIVARGFPTEGLIEGNAWNVSYWENHGKGGTNLFVLGMTSYKTVGGASKTTFVVIPLAKARRGIAPGEFQKMLKDDPDALKPPADAPK